MQASFAVSTYLTPPSQGVTAGATPSAPAEAIRGAGGDDDRGRAMKRLKKGPELKLSAIKPPAFLADLYYDLRDRRLLPLVALVVVAIVAVPFLLGSDPEPVEPPTGVVESVGSAGASSADLTVVEAKPGLRDYRKRLKRRAPTDPFEQRYTSANLKGAELGEGEGGAGEGAESGGEKTSKSTTDGGAPGDDAVIVDEPGADPGRGGGVNPDRPGLTFFAWGIDVRIEKTVDGEKKAPVVRKRVLPQTPLPGEKEPVVTYMGPATTDKKVNGKVLLLISDKVHEVASDARCLSGDEVCQLLEVTPGFPVALTYGDGEARYVVNVTKLQLVITGHS